MITVKTSPLPILGALALVLAACSSSDEAGGKGGGRPPSLVGAEAAKSADFAPRLVALGTVTPLQTVAVRPRAEGEIIAVMFQEGDNVRAGQPLFRLDDRAARAQLAQARAQLASARATAAQASADYGRAQQLVGKGFISGTVLDQRKALAQGGTAGIAGAEAAVRNAETMLSYLTVRAPVSGRTGEINFRLGANVRPADALPLVTVNQLSPISVRFLVPPEEIQNVRGAMAKGRLAVAVRPRTGELDGPPLASGSLAFLDNNVDPGNGSVTAKAEFNNPGDILWPGAIVNVDMALGMPSPRIALPEAAVQTGRDAPFVWTIDGEGKVAMRDVTVAGRSGGKVFLASGVKEGERIVTDALSKLKPGDKVRTKGPGKPGNAPRTAAIGTPAPAGG